MLAELAKFMGTFLMIPATSCSAGHTLVNSIASINVEKAYVNAVMMSIVL